MTTQTPSHVVPVRPAFAADVADTLREELERLQAHVQLSPHVRELFEWEIKRLLGLRPVPKAPEHPKSSSGS
jgi:hypothetical protein